MPPRDESTREKLSVRDATPSETEPFAQIGAETWVGILESETARLGHIVLHKTAQGQVFGHDMTCEASDPVGGSMRLWRAAKRQCHKWGVTEAFCHVDENTPQRIKDFWLARGFAPVMVLLKGSV